MNFAAPSSPGPRPASDAEIAASVGLSLLPGVGPRTTRRWVERVGSAEIVWRYLPAFLESRAAQDEILAAWRSLKPDAIVATARGKGMAVIAMRDPSFPLLLRTIPDPPSALFVRGRLDDAPAVAIVGSRRATPYGRAAAEQLAADLALAGITVVSGLARGIDGAAHRAAIEGGGRTVAVLGCGVDVVYPREHRQLADAVVAHGALVSEFAPGTPPLPGHFPRRNRVISGLALGVVVVEGSEDSGALVTVDYALDQGREVFAVPGSIFSLHSRAPHSLLRQGAHVAETVADIQRELGLAIAASGRDESAGARRSEGDSGETRLLEALEGGPASFDELVDATALPAARVVSLVTVLEVRGLVQTLPGQMVMRTPAARHDVGRRIGEARGS
jgi:DNA processing protein